MKKKEAVPENILFQIFLRLPAKSLCRFKIVANQWNALISDTKFVKDHLQYSYESKRVYHVVYEQSSLPSRIEFDHASLLNGNQPKFRDDWLLVPETNRKKIEILQSCGGLLLIFAAPSKLMLVNPSIREIKTLCDDVSTSFPCGFGYDDLHGDYKVVKIDPQRRVAVFSLMTSSWTYSNLPSDMDWNLPLRFKSLHLSGVIHWFRYSGRIMDDNITAFDLRSEKFVTITPPNSNTHRLWCNLYEIGGALCIGRVDPLNDFCEFWMMEEHGVNRQWKQIASVSFNSLRFVSVKFPQGDEFLFIKGSRLYWYDLKNGTRKEVSIGPIPPGYTKFQLDSYYSYVDSLVTLRA